MEAAYQVQAYGQSGYLPFVKDAETSAVRNHARGRAGGSHNGMRPHIKPYGMQIRHSRAK